MNTNSKFSKFLRFSLTFLVTSTAIYFGFVLWENYMDGTWTRDGRIRADVFMIAPDASGIVSEICVNDNQFVHKGDLLFKISDERFKSALQVSISFSKIKKIEYEMKQHKANTRVFTDKKSISRDELTNSAFGEDLAKAAYDESLAQVEIAKLDLTHTNVYAPADGWVSNLLLKKGNYVKIGENCFALIGSGTFWVNGYFEEHKISKIHAGDIAIMDPLGTNYKIKGHVESIASGITDRDNTLGDRLLANVNPTFTWVRLAQRIPVRIHIDEIPEGFTLIAGMTCSVNISK
ncbi:MAG: HlyD family secretion protein [Sulfurimonas sp.]|jgi:p-hydroxybenzoic acid efflux pump subunit AaeA